MVVLQGDAADGGLGLLDLGLAVGTAAPVGHDELAAPVLGGHRLHQLLELAQVWEMKNKGFAGADKPIIIVGPFWKKLVDMMAEIDAGSVECLQTVETAKEAVEFLSRFFKNEGTI